MVIFIMILSRYTLSNSWFKGLLELSNFCLYFKTWHDLTVATPLLLLRPCFRFQSTRPALSVTIYPLFDQDTAYVMNKIPTKHLEELTIFSSKICQQPPGQCRVKAKTRDRSGKVTVWPWPQASGQASWPCPKASVKPGNDQKSWLWPWPFVRVKPGQLGKGDCVNMTEWKVKNIYDLDLYLG